MPQQQQAPDCSIIINCVLPRTQQDPYLMAQSTQQQMTHLESPQQSPCLCITSNIQRVTLIFTTLVFLTFDFFIKFKKKFFWREDSQKKGYKIFYFFISTRFKKKFLYHLFLSVSYFYKKKRFQRLDKKIIKKKKFLK